MSDIVSLNGYKIKDEKAVRSYESIAQMKADTKLKEGYHVKTKGYYESNDGGSCEYIIVDDETLVDDGGSIHVLNNGLRAKLLISDYVTPEMFGAYGDGTHDDTTAFSKACTLASSNNKQVFLSKNFKIDTLVLPYNTIITGGKLTLIGTLKLTRRNKILNTNIDVSNLGTESTGIALLISNENLIDDQRSEVTIDGVNFVGSCYCLIKLESKELEVGGNNGLYDNNITNITATSTSEYGIIITAEEGAWSNTHLFNNVFLGTVKNTILMDNASAVFNNVSSQAMEGSQYYATMTNASKGIFMGRSQMIDIGNFSSYQFNITYDCFVNTDIEYSTHLVAPIQNKTTDTILLNCFNIFSSTNININREYNLKRLSNNTYNDITGANIGGVIRDVFDKDNKFIGTKLKYGGYINVNYINPEYFIGIKNYKNNTSIFAPYLAIQSDSNSTPVFYEITSAFSGGAYATEDRPANATAGAMIFDTTLNKPIWKYGTKWCDATGTQV